MAHLGSHSTANLDIPYSCSIFYNFHRNKVLNFFVFFYPRDSVRSPDAKKDSEVRHWYVSLLWSNMKWNLHQWRNFLNLSFTSFTPCFQHVSNRNIALYHINFLLSGLEWKICFSSFNKIRKQSPGGVRWKRCF